MIDLTASLVGVASSVAATLILVAARKLRLRSRFAYLAGLYEVYSIAIVKRVGNGLDIATEKRVENEKVRLDYRGGIFFTTRCSGGPSGPWSGTIAMREENPHYGEGTWKYDDKQLFGVHHFQVSPDRLSIYVTFNWKDPIAGDVVWRRAADQQSVIDKVKSVKPNQALEPTAPSGRGSS